MKLTRRKSEHAAEAPPRKMKLREAGEGRRSKKKGGGGRGGRFVIIIGDEGAILVYLQGRKVVRRLFAPSPQPDHTATIVELMAAHPNVPIWILADVLDQQYVRHSFPPVSSLSVSGLVKRRLERDFQSEDMTGSLPLGREKTGRKEWNYLLIALANTPLMQQWLDLIVEQPNELKGIYLAPIEAQVYIPTLKKKLPSSPKVTWQLLVTHNKVSGFRQVVLRDGKLVFTRATQAIDEGVAAVIAGNVEQEILNTLEYLRRLGFTENSDLEMVVIAAQEVKETLDVQRFKAAAAHVLTPFEAAELMKLEQAALSADRFGDVVMAASFALAKKRVLRFSTAYAQKLTGLYNIRRGMTLVAALGTLGLLGMSGSNVISSLGSNEEASRLEIQRTPLQSEIDVLKKSIDGLDQDVAYKSAIVATYDAYMKDALSPLDFVADLAPHLTPAQRVASMEWEPVLPSAAPLPDGTPAGPINVKLEMEFVGNYPDPDVLTKAVESYLAALKTRMPRYTITNDPFPWQSSGQTSVEISFDQKPAEIQTPSESRRIILHFSGPKKLPEAPPGAPAEPGAMP